MTIKVLVVDRTHQTEQLAKEALVPLGCQIITATSTALAVFLARKNFPSLVIAGLDAESDYLDLPGELRSDPDLAHIPIVMVAQDQKRAAAGNGIKWLSLPMERRAFVAEVWPYLRESVDDRPEETSE